MTEQRNDRRKDPINALDTDYEDAGQPALEDTTEDVVLPGDEPVAMDEFGTTGTEKEAGEPLDIALSREEPDIWSPAPGPEGGPEGGAEADPVAGRLVAEDRGSRPDHEERLVAEDEGVDSGGFSAEEQAVHEREEP